MPFDGSGNFSRLFSFTQDRNNGIKILASRVDGEFDNVASALNQSFFRSGIVGMTGDLNLGLNRLTGLSDGAAGNPATKFGTDPTTGLYLAGYGKMGVAAGGAQRAVFDSIGLNVTGTITGGGFYVDSGFNLAKLTSSLVELSFDTGDVLRYDRGANQFDFYVNGASNFSVRPNLVVSNRNMQVEGAFNAAGAITQNGQQVWHTGNLNPSSFPSTNDPTFTGLTRLNPANPLGLIVAQNGTSTGFIQLGNLQGASAVNNYHMGTAFDGTLRFYSGTYASGTERFRIQSDGHAYAMGALHAKGAAYVDEQAVWHAGNFNPAAYAPLTGATFTGDLTTYRAGNSNTGVLYLNSGKDRYLFYNGTSYELANAGLSVGGNIVTTGGITGGNVTATAITGNSVSVAGNPVWHAGNLNPASYALLSGAAFTGGVSGTTFTGSGNFTAPGFFINGVTGFNKPVPSLVDLTFDTGDVQRYDQSGNQYQWYIGGTAYATLSTAGFNANGITRGGQQVAYDGMSRTSARITDGTAAPSGGSDGDFYFQYQ